MTKFSTRFILSQSQLHPVVRNARVDAALGAHRAELCCDFALVAGDNLRPAVRNDGSRYALFRAPPDLHAHSSMPDKPFAPLADERARECRGVANVNPTILHCG